MNSLVDDLQSSRSEILFDHITRIEEIPLDQIKPTGTIYIYTHQADWLLRKPDNPKN